MEIHPAINKKSQSYSSCRANDLYRIFKCLMLDIIMHNFSYFTERTDKNINKHNNYNFISFELQIGKHIDKCKQNNSTM